MRCAELNFGVGCFRSGGRREFHHLISKNNAALYQDEIRDLHQVRAEVFVNQLGWDLRVKDGLEHDEYDDARASNIIGFSTENRVVMGLRFRPTDDCSMLLDHFSHVLPAGIRPIDDGRTWELSRGFCIERGMRRHNLRRKAACMIAPLELAYEAGIDRCVGFTDVRMLSFCYGVGRSEEHTSDLQSLMRISYA